MGERQYSEGEDEAMMSFPVDKGKVVEMKICGSWDTSLPPMPIPRASAATAIYGRFALKLIKFWLNIV